MLCACVCMCVCCVCCVCCACACAARRIRAPQRSKDRTDRIRCRRRTCIGCATCRLCAACQLSRARGVPGVVEDTCQVCGATPRAAGWEARRSVERRVFIALVRRRTASRRRPPRPSPPPCARVCAASSSPSSRAGTWWFATKWKQWSATTRCLWRWRVLSARRAAGWASHGMRRHCAVAVQTWAGASPGSNPVSRTDKRVSSG